MVMGNINELPEKWYVERNSSNFNILNNWCNKQPHVQGTSSNSGYVHNINYGSSGHSGRGHYYADKQVHPEHVEITFQQFKEFVLNIKPKTNKIEWLWNL